MSHGPRLLFRVGLTASQIAQIVWLAFTAFALTCAMAGIPRYFELLHTACQSANCLDAQLIMPSGQTAGSSLETLDLYASVQIIVLLLIDSLLLATAAFLIWQQANQALSVLAAFVATALATSVPIQALAHTDPRFWFPAQFILFVQMGGLLPLLCLFPDGQFRPRVMRWVALLYVLANLIFFLPGYQQWLRPGEPGRILWFGFALVSFLVAVLSMIYRLKLAANSIYHERMLWVLAGISSGAASVLLGAPIRVPALSLIPVEALSLNSAGPIELFGMLLAIGSFTCMFVALFNYETVDANQFLSRTLVYGGLTVSLLLAYGLIVGYLSTVFRSDNLIFSLVATGLVAVLFQPLRDRLQVFVNRLMYGERHEPYRVIARLGQRLESAINPASALPLTVETVARALKLPYAAIRLVMNDELQTVAEFGIATSALTRLPLNYAGSQIGELVVTARDATEPLSDADRRLLADLARQIGIAAHATLLAGELEQARLMIVEASEETRRQLGSDLHDRVGHQLTALTRKAERAATVAEHDPASAISMLREITEQSNAVLTDVRGLAHQLHPPELELLGLAGALRERIELGMGPGLVIRFDAPNTLPPLPTAIETAAYFIALEALTNVEKHAGAGSCCIRLALEPRMLELEITDDGPGIGGYPAEPGLGRGAKSEGRGLGLLSMQARAAEVGGTCRVEPGPHGGTRVIAMLPVMDFNFALSSPKSANLSHSEI